MQPVYAQVGTYNPAQFGRINVQYKTFDWQYLQSRNFDVYFYGDGEYLAQYAAVVLEEAAQELQRTMSFTLSDRIPVLIYLSNNDFTQSNSITTLLPRGMGGTIELSKNRMSAAFEGRWAEFRHQLRHRLVLAFSNEMFFNGVLQSAVLNGWRVEYPQWFALGFAEFFAAGGMDNRTDSYVRDLVLSKRFPSSPTQMSQEDMYHVGQALWGYITSKFGMGKIGEVMNRLRAVGVLENVFRVSFGVGVEAFWKIWQQDLLKQYTPESSRFEQVEAFARLAPSEAIASSGSLLLKQPASATAPSSSADADKARAPVAARPRLATALAPAADKYAYWEAGDDDVMNVMVADLKTGKINNLLSVGRAHNPDNLHTFSTCLTWSPDGKQLATVISSGGDDGFALVHLQSGRSELIMPAGRNVTDVAWSPDGKVLAYSAVQAGVPQLFLYDLAMKKSRQLTNDPFSKYHIVWSWDSRTLYFFSDRGRVQVNQASAQSSLSAPSRGVQPAALQPAGATIALNAVNMWEHDVMQQDIFALSLATLSIERVTHDPFVHKTSFAVLPTNAGLLVAAERNGIANLYRYDFASKTLLPRTNAVVSLGHLSLARNGSLLALLAQSGGAERIFLMANPLDRATIRELELTSYRKELADMEAIAGKTADLLNRKNSPELDAAQQQRTETAAYPSDSIKGYGVFDVDFSRQRMVFPDVDAAAMLQRQSGLQDPSNTSFLGAPGKLKSQPYKFSLTNDFVSPNFDWDTFVGFRLNLQTMFTDIMGNHRLFAAAKVMWTLSDVDLLASYAYLPDVIDYEVNAFYTGRLWFLFDPLGRELLFSRINFWGIGGRAMLPLTSVSRLEGSLRWINTSRTVVNDGRVNDVHMMFVPEVRYVFDNTTAGVFAPESGIRAFAALDASPGVGIATPSVTFVRLTADYRQYIPLHSLVTLAVRAAGGVSAGADAPQFFMSNADNIIIGRELSQGIFPYRNARDLALSTPITPMRGFAIGSAIGTNYFVGNVEARIPIIRTASAGILGGLFQRLSGTVFWDVGSAWSGALRPSLPKILTDQLGNQTPPQEGDIFMSFGLGLRSFVIGFPVRLDVAWLNLQGGWSTPRWTVGFGLDF
jgi:Tol biopolymer transport system component